MNEEELMAKAIADYPIGTEFIPAHLAEDGGPKLVVKGRPEWYSDHIKIAGDYSFVPLVYYSNGEVWAKITKKVETNMVKRGDYIVTIDGDFTGTDCAKRNYCFKQREDDIYIRPCKDLGGSMSNGNSNLRFDKSKNLKEWRYATDAEKAEYKRLGMPYDVTTIKPTVKPKAKDYIGQYVVILKEYVQCTSYKVGEIDKIIGNKSDNTLAMTRNGFGLTLDEMENGNFKIFPTEAEAKTFSDSLLGKSTKTTPTVEPKKMLSVYDLVVGRWYFGTQWATNSCLKYKSGCGLGTERIFADSRGYEKEAVSWFDPGGYYEVPQEFLDKYLPIGHLDRSDSKSKLKDFGKTHNLLGDFKIGDVIWFDSYKTTGTIVAISNNGSTSQNILISRDDNKGHHGGTSYILGENVIGQKNYYWVTLKEIIPLSEKVEKSKESELLDSDGDSFVAEQWYEDKNGCKYKFVEIVGNSFVYCETIEDGAYDSCNKNSIDFNEYAPFNKVSDDDISMYLRAVDSDGNNLEEDNWYKDDSGFYFRFSELNSDGTISYSESIDSDGEYSDSSGSFTNEDDAPYTLMEDSEIDKMINPPHLDADGNEFINGRWYRDSSNNYFKFDELDGDGDIRYTESIIGGVYEENEYWESYSEDEFTLVDDSDVEQYIVKTKVDTPTDSNGNLFVIDEWYKDKDGDYLKFVKIENDCFFYSAKKRRSYDAVIESSSDQSFSAYKPYIHVVESEVIPAPVENQKPLKVGDRVRIITLDSSKGRMSGTIGHIGIVNNISSDGFYYLTPTAPGACWPADCLKLIEPKTETTHDQKWVEGGVCRCIKSPISGSKYVGQYCNLIHNDGSARLKFRFQDGVDLFMNLDEEVEWIGMEVAIKESKPSDEFVMPVDIEEPILKPVKAVVESFIVKVDC